jgi:tetratricopeptide (TPR) repeat protein
MGADSALASLIRDKGTPNIARATALAEIGPYLSQTTVDVIPLALADPDPSVRAAAVGALEQTPVNMRVSLAFRMLNDPVRAVRIEAARILMAIPAGELSPQQWALLNKAMQEYVAAQMANAERPEAQTNLGNFYAAQGEVEKALKAYQTSIALSPMYIPGYVNLADLYRSQGDEVKAEEVLRQAIGSNPSLAVPHHVLGLSLVRQKRMDEALTELALAAKLDPNNVRYTYIYAVALQSTGKAQQAIKILETVYYQHPNNRDVLSALAAFHRDAGNQAAAQDYAEKLRSLSP